MRFQYGGNSKQELLQLLSARKVAFNAYAIELFMCDEFTVSSHESHAELSIVTPQSLGFSQGCTFDKLCNAAMAKELGFCSLEAAAYLRLYFTEQVGDDSYLTVASIPPRETDAPNGFYLRSYNDQCWLRGYAASPDYTFDATMQFAFLVNA